MNILLTPEEEANLMAKVSSGRYSSPSEVVKAALKLLDEREKELLQRRQAAQSILDSISPVKLSRNSTDIIREERERRNQRL